MPHIYPPPLIIEPQQGYAHTHTVIFLHGRSSTASEFAADILALKTSSDPPNTLDSIFPAFRWVFLDAGERWCTAFGEDRSAWFDMYSLKNQKEKQDLPVTGLREGIQLIRRTVEGEANLLGGALERIILGGFSQGAATALWSFFTGIGTVSGRLGAFVGISAWMPYMEEAQAVVRDEAPAYPKPDRAARLTTTFADVLGVDPETHSESTPRYTTETPVFLGHGADDMLISVRNCHCLAGLFRALGVSLEIHAAYEGADREGHWIKEPNELDDLVAFLNRIVVGEGAGADSELAASIS